MVCMHHYYTHTHSHSRSSDAFSRFDDEIRQEFIFRIFQSLVVGGTLCQTEHEVQPYLDTVKALYKAVVHVRRDPNTLKVQTDGV
jgi:hypothetical protein